MLFYNHIPLCVLSTFFILHIHFINKVQDLFQEHVVLGADREGAGGVVLAREVAGPWKTIVTIGEFIYQEGKGFIDGDGIVFRYGH